MLGVDMVPLQRHDRRGPSAGIAYCDQRIAEACGVFFTTVGRIVRAVRKARNVPYCWTGFRHCTPPDAAPTNVVRMSTRTTVSARWQAAPLPSQLQTPHPDLPKPTGDWQIVLADQVRP